MPATETLGTTTLLKPVAASDRLVSVESVSGLIPGMRLFCDGELMALVSLGIGTEVVVRRGVDGTIAAPHDSSATVYAGRADQFYRSDPVGAPPEAIHVSPWINVANGSIYFANGDEGGARWWQKQTTTYSIGALGIRIAERTPTSST